MFDIREKRLAIDRPIKHRRCAEPLQAQGGDDRVRLPVAARRVIVEARTARTSAIAAEQIRGDAAFIQKDVVPSVAQRLGLSPLPSRGRDVRSTLFVGVYRFS